MIWLPQNQMDFCHRLSQFGAWLRGGLRSSFIQLVTHPIVTKIRKVTKVTQPIVSRLKLQTKLQTKAATAHRFSPSANQSANTDGQRTDSIANEMNSQGGLRSQGVWDNSDTHESSYWTASSAPAEMLWQMLTNLADLASWHPLIASTNAPRGQLAKPGLIYRACSRYLPVSTQVFVERVLPGELLSIRLFPLPGLQERVTYRIVSTLCGTCVLYSMTLSGWLSPLAWPMMKPQATRVAAALVEAAEQAILEPEAYRQRLCRVRAKTDIFGESI